MKLNWLRAGCASIAECGRYTAIVWKTHTGTWAVDMRDASGKNHSNPCGSSLSRETAEASCESWLDKHDKPQWKQAEEWLWSTTWRGACCAVRLGIDDRWSGMIVCGRWGKHSASYADLDAAKSECETIMRERTEGAK